MVRIYEKGIQILSASEYNGKNILLLLLLLFVVY